MYILYYSIVLLDIYIVYKAWWVGIKNALWFLVWHQILNTTFPLFYLQTACLKQCIISFIVNFLIEILKFQKFLVPVIFYKRVFISFGIFSRRKKKE